MPGMAANPKIFQYLRFTEDYEVRYMHWLIPGKEETLLHYTSRLRTQIKHENPILLGVSFGGIIVQELAKQMEVKKLVLISTVKHHEEFPPFFETVLRYRLYKLFPAVVLQRPDWLEKLAFTRSFKQKMNLYQKYMDVNDSRYLNWAIRQVLKWKQTQDLKNFVHIVGEKDKVFPVKYIKEPKIVVPGGRHDMIIFHVRWFNKYLPGLISR